MKLRGALFLLGLAAAVAAIAGGVDRGIVEDGTNTTVADDTTGDGGVLLVKRNGSTRLRPATCSGTTCTRVAPDAGTEGISMEDLAACLVTACAPGTQVLAATGELELWNEDGALQRWGHMDGKDLQVTVTDACQSWPIELSGMRATGRRVVYRPNGVGVSGSNDGGQSLTTSIQCCRPSSAPLAAPGCGP
jgi:hypothetical protein